MNYSKWPTRHDPNGFLASPGSAGRLSRECTSFGIPTVLSLATVLSAAGHAHESLRRTDIPNPRARDCQGESINAGKGAQPAIESNVRDGGDVTDGVKPRVQRNAFVLDVCRRGTHESDEDVGGWLAACLLT